MRENPMLASLVGHFQVNKITPVSCGGTCTSAAKEKTRLAPRL
jgi:hypothetical protein